MQQIGMCGKRFCPNERYSCPNERIPLPGIKKHNIKSQVNDDESEMEKMQNEKARWSYFGRGKKKAAFPVGKATL